MDSLVINSLTYRYPSGTELSFPDFSCLQGENLLILGNSGSGKTSLLHLMAGILTPASGDIVYNDVSLRKLSAGERDRFRGRNMGMIFQKHYFLQGISVWENLKAACILSGNKVDSQYLRMMLNKLGIEHLASKQPEQLSEGEQQRFSIARAMANQPSWIFADEPTSSLDDHNCENFLGLMHLSILHKPVSWIIATHDKRLKDHFQNIYSL